jgi:proline dehydrogenase
MLRNALLWASTNPFLAERLPRYASVRRATRRFMPGETLEDALAEAARLRDQGLASYITLLGESARTAREADEVVEHYLGALEAIRNRGLDTEVSLKLTQLGVDFGADEARRRLERLVRWGDPGALVWVDMESSAYVEATIECFRAVREDHQNVGVALQAYLHRTRADLESLLPLHPAVRLVKGAYRERSSVAFPKKSDVDQNYLSLARTLLRARAEGRAGRPVFGTHDLRIIGEVTRMAEEPSLGKDAYEIAMLYGIRSADQERLAKSGYSVRVLVSYGSEWFPWYMRRLAERPANLWFAIKSIARG